MSGLISDRSRACEAVPGAGTVTRPTDRTQLARL